MNKLYNIILDLLFTVTHPSYYTMNNPYNEEWDNYLNYLMKQYMFEKTGDHTAKIGNISVWISNFPYAAFTPYSNNFPSKIRPSRRTIHKAMKKFLQDAMLLNEKTLSSSPKNLTTTTRRGMCLK